MSKYWYFKSTWECPYCGSETKYIERRYTPRPEKWEDRHEWKQSYDYCVM